MHNRHKSVSLRVVWHAALGLLLLSLAASMSMLFVSAHNYPGGQALYQLHQKVASRGAWFSSTHHGTQAEESVTVHIGVLPAMTGVSRFLELEGPWTYSKVMSLLLTCAAG